LASPQSHIHSPQEQVGVATHHHHPAAAASEAQLPTPPTQWWISNPALKTIIYGILLVHGSKGVDNVIQKNVQEEVKLLIIVTKDFYTISIKFKVLFINMKENIQGVNYTLMVI